MEKKDFRNLLSKALEKNNNKVDKKLELQAKRIKKDVREEFSRFVDISIVPQFEGIRKEMNDASHCRDQILRTLVKHEDRFDHLGSRQDKILKTLEKHGEILGKHGDQLERIEAKL